MSPKILCHSYNIVKTTFRNFKHFQQRLEPNSCPHVVHQATSLSASWEWLRRDIWQAKTATILAQDLSNLIRFLSCSLEDGWQKKKKNG